MNGFTFRSFPTQDQRWITEIRLSMPDHTEVVTKTESSTYSESVQQCYLKSLSEAECIMREFFPTRYISFMTAKHTWEKLLRARFSLYQEVVAEKKEQIIAHVRYIISEYFTGHCNEYERQLLTDLAIDIISSPNMSSTLSQSTWYETVVNKMHATPVTVPRLPNKSN